MTPAMPRKGGLGWLVLAGALAVPCLLFYNWWSSLKAEHERGNSNHLAAAHSEVFRSTSAAATTEGRAQSETTSNSSTMTASAAPTSALVPAAPASAQAAVMPPKSLEPSAVSSSAPAAVPAVSPPPAATVVLSRDPMLSQLDTVRLRENDDERDRTRSRRHRGERTPASFGDDAIMSHIDLQGIVATPGGSNMAIVNGLTAKVGSRIRVRGYTDRVHVVRIFPSAVLFEYKDKKFTIKVSN